MRAAYLVTRLERGGRVRLPKFSEQCFGDSVEISVEEGRIVLEKYVPRCIFCGGLAGGRFRGRNVCSERISIIRKLFS